MIFFTKSNVILSLTDIDLNFTNSSLMSRFLFSSKFSYFAIPILGAYEILIFLLFLPKKNKSNL